MDAQTKMSVLDRIGRGIPANKRLRLGLKRETRAVKGEGETLSFRSRGEIRGAVGNSGGQFEIEEDSGESTT